jgi:hypothetical protein
MMDTMNNGCWNGKENARSRKNWNSCGLRNINRRRGVKKVIEWLDRAGAKLAEAMYVNPENELIDEANMCINQVIEELETPRWYTPERWEAETGEAYPREAPAWAVSEWEISEKPTKYNRLRWTLNKYGDVADCEDAIIFCAYGHLGPPPNDWRPEEGM